MLVSMSHQMSELEALRTAVEHLNAGRLEHFVVSHTKLTGSLTMLKHTHPEVTISRLDARYYYQESKVKLFRVGRQLLIVLDVPLTLQTTGRMPLTIYKLMTIPLASPTSTTDYTMLQTDIQAIAYSKDAPYFIQFTENDVVPMGSIIDLEKTGLTLQDRDTATSCGLMLMEGTLADIKKARKYQIIRAPLVPTVYKLTSNKYLLSNITKAKMTCNKAIHLKTAEKEIVLQNTQNIIHVDCGCFVQADQFVLIDSSFDCRQELNLNTTGRAFFILNLPYISEFLDDSSLDVLPGDFFLNTSIPVILPTLAVASKKL